jgi:hypothetical protein
MPRDVIFDLRAPVLSAYAQFTQAVPSVAVWDPLPALCPGAFCSQSADGRPLFFDGDHLSGFGDRLLEPGFAAFLLGEARH